MTLEEALAALAALQKKFDTAEAELKTLRSDAKSSADGKVVELTKQLETIRAEKDAAAADVKRLQDAQSSAPKVADLVKSRMAVIDGARALHVKASDVNLDATDREIMVAALKARDPDFKELRADGKPESDDYVRARFDLAVQAQRKANDSYTDVMRSSGAGGAGSTPAMPITDGSEAGLAIRTYDASVAGNQAYYMNRWKGEDVATRAREDARKTVMEGRQLPPGFVSAQFDGREAVERGIASVREFVPRTMLDMFCRIQGVRRDSDPATAFFSRQLLYIMTTPYEYIYAPIKYASLFPVTYEVPTGARTWAAHQFDDLGAADIVDDYADDAPNAEIVGHELIGRLFPVRSEYTYSLQDVRSAMMANMPLDALKAQRARRIIERKCDALAAVGDTGHSFKGAANDTNATTATATTKAAGATQWIISGAMNATPNEILNDVNLLYNKILTATGGDVEMDTLYVGKNAWGVLQTQRLDNFNQTTIGEYLRTKLAWLKRIEYWPRLNTAGGSSVERIMGCAINPEYFRFVISQEFEQLPPQPVNMSWKVPCHKRWGEPQMMQPKVFCYMDNTSS